VTFMAVGEVVAVEMFLEMVRASVFFMDDRAARL